MNEEDLKNYKTVYMGLNVPPDVVSEKWDVVSPLLSEQEKKRDYRFLPYATVFLSLFFVLFATGIVHAKPGNLLYPLKALTVHFTSTISSPFTKRDPVVVPNFTISKPTVATPPKPASSSAEPKDTKSVKGAETNNSEASHSVSNTGGSRPAESSTVNNPIENHGNGSSENNPTGNKSGNGSSQNSDNGTRDKSNSNNKSSGH